MRLKFWIGILISAGLLALMFWWIGFDFRRLWDAMRGIEPWHLAAATVSKPAVLCRQGTQVALSDGPGKGTG